jgi:hypothetical protein
MKTLLRAAAAVAALALVAPAFAADDAAIDTTKPVVTKTEKSGKTAKKAAKHHAKSMKQAPAADAPKAQ